MYYTIRVREGTRSAPDYCERTLTVEVDIPATVNGLLEKYSPSGISTAVCLVVVKRVQDAARRLMRQGRSDQEIRAFLRHYNPLGGA